MVNVSHGPANLAAGPAWSLARGQQQCTSVEANRITWNFSASTSQTRPCAASSMLQLESRLAKQETGTRCDCALLTVRSNGPRTLRPAYAVFPTVHTVGSLTYRYSNLYLAAAIPHLQLITRMIPAAWQTRQQTINPSNPLSDCHFQASQPHFAFWPSFLPILSFANHLGRHLPTSITFCSIHVALGSQHKHTF